MNRLVFIFFQGCAQEGSWLRTQWGFGVVLLNIQREPVGEVVRQFCPDRHALAGSGDHQSQRLCLQQVGEFQVLPCIFFKITI